ncbi:MAG: HAMP domain-containing sensor histidine kinase [Bacteroidota bacterium]
MSIKEVVVNGKPVDQDTSKNLWNATSEQKSLTKRENIRVPSLINISFLLGILLTAVYVFINVLNDYPTEKLIYSGLIFFVTTVILLILFLEILVFRKLKNVYSLNQREIDKLKNLETYRREFLGEVSHELKTPIFAIQGFIHTLIDGAMDDERVRMKFLRKAMKNSDRLSNLVEDLLIITQAESGEMEIRLTKFNLYYLVLEVIESLEKKFTSKKRNITHDILTNGHENVMVMADRERILQVLTNLVDNAIKYGDSNGTVEIELVEIDSKMHVKVSDDGTGMEEEHLDKIFRRFYRVDKSRSREKGGTGLGLAICKHLLTVHGESIWVQSKVGKGTTFTFTLKKS